ncbi:PREDICTED: glutamate receptor ionotropic, kainate 3-like [Ceratosolen solmsi marchali]|uniref:Glutamate receptor ionotropic, kainate 3-like n=1 Tax=Ceratosolen solmsi marchali TaxID=326594 RepID=A0AAJ6YRA1_9HYME|nr:PREDICTED: glutamate receptor ionotropic, kainate 3-like [Ceratosolen solmsi marchali]
MVIIWLYVLQLFTLPCFSMWVPIGSMLKVDNFTQAALLSSIKNINLSYNRNDILRINISIVHYQDSSDILEISNKACILFEKGVSAIFGYLDRAISKHVQSMCDAMEIPYITVQWDPYQERGRSINLYPYADALAKIYYLIIKDMKWKSFILLYDSTNSLIRLKLTLKKLNTINYPIVFYRIINETNYRYVLKDIKDSGEKNIVIDCSYDILENLLYQALQVGIISDKYNLFITSLEELKSNSDQKYTPEEQQCEECFKSTKSRDSTWRYILWISLVISVNHLGNNLSTS